MMPVTFINPRETDDEMYCPDCKGYGMTGHHVGGAYVGRHCTTCHGSGLVRRAAEERLRRKLVGAAVAAVAAGKDIRLTPDGLEVR